MANINITFDGTDYLVDSSLLELASTALKTHLTSDMAGSGATIKLGNQSYNIDSAKLTTARNDFVTHLGTIAGTGKKVKVNGVEYGIDTAKTADAVAELHEVLGGMVSGGDDYDHNAPELHPAGIIPEGATYTVTATSEVLNTGDAFPVTVEEGDIYTYGHYEYRYNYYPNSSVTKWYKDTEQAGWGVAINTSIIDKNQASYGAILESIDGISVTNMSYTFYNCTNLEVTPIIPSSITKMEGAFQKCSNLKVTPVIPNSVTNMEYTFCNCSNLEVAPVISASVTNMGSTFSGCTNLKTYIGSTDADGDFSGFVLPASATMINAAFQDCVLLEVAPVIPSSVTDVSGAFMSCTALEIAPILPAGVTEVSGLFSGCTNLKTYMGNADGDFSGYVIPGGTNLINTFAGCTALSGNIIINTNPDVWMFCFQDVDMTNITLTGSAPIEKLNKIGATGKNWTNIQ